MSLKLQNLSKSYSTKDGVKVQALKDVCLEFPDTGMIFIVGKSGCGKSTLLNILGLLDKYDSGQLLINGKDSLTFSTDDLDRFRAIILALSFKNFI